MKTISAEYLAWVADSDWSFSYNKKFSKPRWKYYYVGQFQITWKLSPESREFFERLVSQFWWSFFIWKTKTVYGNTQIIKYCATWQACSKICAYVVNHLLLKKEQAQIALEGSLLKTNKYGVKWKPQSVWDSEKILYDRIKYINTKNKWQNL